MRFFSGYVLVAALVGALAGCSGGGSSPGKASPAASAVGAVSATASAVASSSPRASASASTAPLLGALPVPDGATPWHKNTNSLLSLTPFIQAWYAKNLWTGEHGVLTRRGYVSGVYEGWINPDDSQQSVIIIRFASVNGAVSEFDGRIAVLHDDGTASDKLADPTDGSEGMVITTLDSLGNARAELVTHVGDYVIDVCEYTAAQPDPTAARALMLRQYQRLKSAGLPGA